MLPKYSRTEARDYYIALAFLHGTHAGTNLERNIYMDYWHATHVWTHLEPKIVSLKKSIYTNRPLK
jgi:hypothetical protein